MNNNFFIGLDQPITFEKLDLNNSFPDVVVPFKVDLRNDNYYLCGYFVSYEDWIDNNQLLNEIEKNGFRRIVNSNCEFLLFLFDRRKGKLFVCVDQFLSFSCYFSVVDGSLIFSTDFGALKNEVGKKQKLKGDLDGLLTGLLWSWHMTERTLIEQIKMLPAGSAAEFDLTNLSDFKISSLLNVDDYLNSIENREYKSMAEFAPDWLRAVTEAVGVRWSKIPKGAVVGCDLSSGFDCTLVAYCLSRVAGSDAFTCYSRYSDLLKNETNIEVVKKFANRHGLKLKSIDATKAQRRDSDLAGAWSADDPYQIATDNYGVYLGMLRKNKVRVDFRGEGGDEVYRLKGMDLFLKFPRQYTYFLDVDTLRKFNAQALFTDKAISLFLDWQRFNRRKFYPMIIPDSWAIGTSVSCGQYNNSGLRMMNPFLDTRLIGLGKSLPAVQGKYGRALKLEVMKNFKYIFVEEMFLQQDVGTGQVAINFAINQRKLIDSVLDNSVLARLGLIDPDKIRMMLLKPESEIYKNDNVAMALESLVTLDWFCQKNDIGF